MQIAPFLPPSQELSNWALSLSQKHNTFQQASSVLLESQASGPQQFPLTSELVGGKQLHPMWANPQLLRTAAAARMQFPGNTKGDNIQANSLRGHSSSTDRLNIWCWIEVVGARPQVSGFKLQGHQGLLTVHHVMKIHDFFQMS